MIRTLVNSMSHILSSLMRVDETCRQVIYDLAPPDRAIDEAVLGDASAVERIMEQRLQVFRKTVRFSFFGFAFPRARACSTCLFPL